MPGQEPGQNDDYYFHISVLDAYTHPFVTM